MRNGAGDRCDHFMSRSFVSYTVPDILNTGLSADTRFFDMMGDDDKRMAFFQAFVRLRRASDPEFGRCCYVDSKSPQRHRGQPVQRLQLPRGFRHPAQASAGCRHRVRRRLYPFSSDAREASGMTGWMEDPHRVIRCMIAIIMRITSITVKSYYISSAIIHAWSRR